MRMLLASTGAAIGLILCTSFGVPANAETLATRCGPQGCDHIKCHNDGNFCVRFSDYDPRYNGYIGAVGYGNYGGYGGYGGYYGNGYYGNEYYGNGYNGGRYVGNEYQGTGVFNGNGHYGGYGAGSYGNGYYGGYGGHLVCDSYGDRCYESSTPYWNYRDYYRVHGYHWNY